jgi:predicted DNA-binding protein YlxM (UPF0122 family)
MKKINALLGALLLSVSVFVQSADLATTEQRALRKELYGMNDFSQITSENYAVYKKIMHDHIVKLEKKIKKYDSLFSMVSLDGVKGLVFASLSVYLGYGLYGYMSPKFDSSYQGYDHYDDITLVNFLKEPYFATERLTSGVILLSTKIAFDYLKNAWNRKARAQNRLMRDKGVLYELERA